MSPPVRGWVQEVSSGDEERFLPIRAMCVRRIQRGCRGDGVPKKGKKKNKEGGKEACTTAF